MTEYEILLLLDPDLEEGRQGEVVTRTRDLVEKAGGSWDVHDVWGRRKLAFEIDHKGEGVYHLLQFTCEAGTLDEISRVLRIDDGVLRHMATRRIEGSPARPVAASAPTREDAEVAAPADGDGERAGRGAGRGADRGRGGVGHGCRHQSRNVLVGSLTRDPELGTAFRHRRVLAALRSTRRRRGRRVDSWTDKPNYFDINV